MKPIGTTQELWLKSLGFMPVPDYVRETYCSSLFEPDARMVSRQLSASDLTITYLIDSGGEWWMIPRKITVGGFAEQPPTRLEGTTEDVLRRAIPRFQEKAKKMN